MMAMPEPPVLEMHRVSKRYSALRPLRIASVKIGSGERVTIAGLDAVAAELLVNLVTAAALPDTGEIRIFGRPTAEIASGDDWLASLDRFGIVSPRAVLLESATLQQNLAMPFTLEIDPVPSGVASNVRHLAVRSGIDPERWLGVRAGELPADVRARAHFARALALEPRFILMEHPTADVQPAGRSALAADIVRAGSEPAVSMLILTNDEAFAKAVAPRNLQLNGATGELKPLRKRWF